MWLALAAENRSFGNDLWPVEKACSEHVCITLLAAILHGQNWANWTINDYCVEVTAVHNFLE